MTEKPRKLRIALIGLGTHMLRGHYHPLRENPYVDIVAGFDPGPANPEFDLPRISEEEIFADTSIDAVVVSSPDRFHTDALDRAVSAGKSALVDKPLADTTRDAERLKILLADASHEGLIVSSCHPRRFDPPYLWLKENLKDFTDQLGRPLEIRLDFFYQQPSKSGLHTGLLSDHFNHEIDLVNFLFGSDSFEAKRLFDSEIQYAAAGVRADDISFHFFGNRALTNSTYHEQAEIRFERGCVRMNTGSGVTHIEKYNQGVIIPDRSPTTDYIERFYELNDNFVQACLGKTESYLTDEEMLTNTISGIELSSTGFYSSL